MDEDHPLAFLVGDWEGAGRGHYPSIEPFEYREVLEIRTSPKGFLTHQQRTQRAEGGEPLHAETGYWRCAGNRVELLLAHPTGVAELCEGHVDGRAVHVRSANIACTGSAKPVQTVERWYERDGDVLRYRLWMGAVGLEHQPHLEGVLHLPRS